MEEFDTLTAVGDVPGTLTYVSPERLDGRDRDRRRRRLGGRRDALGVARGQAIRSARATPPAPRGGSRPARRRSRRSGPTCREPLLATRSRSALEPDPARRPSAAQLAAELRERAAQAPARCPARPSRRAEPRPRRELRSARRRSERLAPGRRGGAWTGWVDLDAAVLPGRLAARADGRRRGHRARVPAGRASRSRSRSRSSRSRTSRSGSRSSSPRSAPPGSALTWTDPRGNIALVAGPLLGPLGGARAAAARRPARARPRPPRRCRPPPASLLAVLVAGLRGQPPPVRRHARRRSGSGSPAARVRPRSPGRSGARSRRTRSCSARRACSPPPPSRCPTCAAAGPGPPPIAGAALLAATALGAPAAAFLPLVAAAWLTAGFLRARAPGRAGACRRGDDLDERAVRPDEQQVLAVSQARDGADLLARAGCRSRSARRRSASRRRRSARRSRAPRAARSSSAGVVEALVRDRDEQPRRSERRRAARRAPPGAPRLRVVGAPPLAAVDAACWRRRSSPAHPSGRASPRRGSWRRTSAGCTAGRRRRGRRRAAGASAFASSRETVPAGPGDRLGQPQLELVVGARRPRLQVGHLQPGRAVDAVGGLEQRGQEHAALDRRERVAVDRVADRVDPARRCAAGSSAPARQNASVK